MHKIHHIQIKVKTEIPRLLVTVNPLASMNNYKRICIIKSIYLQ